MKNRRINISNGKRILLMIIPIKQCLYLYYQLNENVSIETSHNTAGALDALEFLIKKLERGLKNHPLQFRLEEGRKKNTKASREKSNIDRIEYSSQMQLNELL